tara:strand:+ start:246 stop:416 length:171 start_codon:yes stop_codon:yes gene_type:complete
LLAVLGKIKTNNKKAMAFKMKSPFAKKGPCWKGYEMVGTKKKGGRKVPNCVPKKKK